MLRVKQQSERLLAIEPHFDASNVAYLDLVCDGRDWAVVGFEDGEADRGIIGQDRS